MIRRYLRVGAEYESRFKVEAMALQDELWTRLPDSVRAESGTKYAYAGGNAMLMGTVADDLERLARLLPEARAATPVRP